MRGFYAFLLAAILVLGAACRQGPAKAPVIGEAFAGPITLNIRQEISPKAPTVATVKHGDRLAILQIRRRFTRVRTENGAEGWCEGEKLLTPEQMERLRATNEVAAKLPSQGQAMVYDLLNIHTEPNRQAPSFHQLKENDKMDVLGHRLVARVPFQSAVSRQLAVAAEKPAPKKRAPRRDQDKGKAESFEQPPMPRPPGPPVNWLEISRRNPLPFNETKPNSRPPAPGKTASQPAADPVRMEDWSLVRSREGRAGWVLTRALTMTIPDEVAQYAEGHRITSWFPLGEVTAEDGTVKNHYLWTTIPLGGQDYEFDGLRVFIFNARRKRYETAFRLREVKGYFPSAVHPVEVTVGKKTETVTGFSVVLATPGGELERRIYAFEGYRVRLISTSPWARLADPFDLKATQITRPAVPAQEQEKSLWERFKEKLPFLRQD